MGKLTAASVRGIKKPGKYYDLHGLILRVAPGGSKQWVWRGTVRGRRRDIGMGAVAYTTLAEARDIAYEYRKLARAGIDPKSRRANNYAPTFAEAAEQVIEAYRPGWKDTGRSEENWRSSLRRYVYPALGSTPVDEITTADLVRVLLPIWHTKAETARKLKTRLGVVLRWSIAAGYRTDDPAGPALAVALPRHTTPAKHLASLPHDQVGPTLEKLDTLPRAWPPTVACLRFLAATAARSGEARFATWDEVDLETRTWTVPAERTKTNREHVVPLSTVGARGARRGPPLLQELQRLRSAVPLPRRQGAEQRRHVEDHPALRVHAPRAEGLVPVVGGRDRGPPRGRRGRAGALGRSVGAGLPALRSAGRPAGGDGGVEPPHLMSGHRREAATTAMGSGASRRSSRRERGPESNFGPLFDRREENFLGRSRDAQRHFDGRGLRDKLGEFAALATQMMLLTLIFSVFLGRSGWAVLAAGALVASLLAVGASPAGARPPTTADNDHQVVGVRGRRSR